MLRYVYRSSEAAMARGVGEIRTAATKLGLNLKAIEMGVLADPHLHLRVRTLAQQINGGWKP